MAEDTDPFQFDMSTLAQEWNTALGDPEVRTALLQFGISALQPPGFGDTAGGMFGRALGSAGEALGRRDEMARKQLEAESKADLRTSQAQLAEQRAASEGVKTEYKGRELDYKEQQARDKREQARLSNIIREQGMRAQQLRAYEDYKEKTNKANTDPLRPRDAPIIPIMPFQEWLRQAPTMSGAQARPVPSAAAVDFLIQNYANNPNIRQEFNNKYGHRAADDYIGPE